MKKIMTLIFEPFKFFANRIVAEKLSIYLSKNPALIVIISIFVTLTIIFFTYIFPNITW
ncbi:MAG: hypothetical protein RBQ78_03645 [Acholeplasmataceae bacterium]|jgi:hypothetical protein|nr:hypothetical protein [Acholeplasmataceae bacterium]